MEIKDLLLKIARNETLSQGELDELGRFGTDTQQRNAKVSGWANQNFTNPDPTLRQLDFRTLGAKVRMDTHTAIGSSSPTYFPWEFVDYYDIGMVDLAANNTRITIPRTGRYFVGINFAFDPIASSFWRADIYVNRTTLLTSGTQNQSGVFGTINVSEDAILTIGDYVETRITQATGSSKNVLGANMFVRWLGVN